MQSTFKPACFSKFSEKAKMTLERGNEMNELYAKRLGRVIQAMKEKSLDGLIISDPKSIWYLSGVENDPYERMYVLYIGSDGKGSLFVNKLFNVCKNDFEVFWYSDTDDCVGLLAKNIPDSGTIGIDKTWSARFLIPLMERNGKAKYVLGSECVASVRG